MFNISRARVHVIVKNMEQKEAKVEASTLNN